MITSVKTHKKILVLILVVFSFGYAYAHNKVVVVPLVEDASIDSFLLWARVEANGTLINGSPSVTSEKSSAVVNTGRYVVRFPRDISNCAMIVQNNVNVNNLATGLVYEYTTTPSDPNDVFVYFEDESGDADDRMFSILVRC